MTQPLLLCCGCSAPIFGRCCLPNGDCVPNTTPSECSGLGGVFGSGLDCGPPNPCPSNPSCTLCQTPDLMCYDRPFFCSATQEWAFNKAQRCMHLTITATSDPTFAPLVGLTVPCHTVITEIMCDVGPLCARGFYVSGGFQVQNYLYRVSYVFSAYPTTAPGLPACPQQWGCATYTGPNSHVTLGIEATPLSSSVAFHCPGIGAGNIIGPPYTRTEQVFRPVNPCDVGAITTSFATAVVSSPFGGETGILPGQCDNPAPLGACCYDDGSCLNTTNATCVGQGGSWNGPGSSCDFVQCPPANPLGACCFPNGSCNNMTQSLCVIAGGVWGGANTSCSTTACQVLGACCHPLTGNCSDRTEAQCQSIGGNWQGPGTVCATTRCPQPPNPVGACCHSGNICSEVTAAECAALAGQYHGDGSQCGSVNCAPTGACCINGVCSSPLTEQQCVGQQGIWIGPGTTCVGFECPPADGLRLPSRGFGDTLQKFFRAVGIERLVKRRAARTGKPCKCNQRRDAINGLMPYRKELA